LGAIRFNRHPAAATVPGLPSTKLGRERLEIDRQAGRHAFDDRHERLAVRFTRREKTQHPVFLRCGHRGLAVRRLCGRRGRSCDRQFYPNHLRPPAAPESRRTSRTNAEAAKDAKKERLYFLTAFAAFAFHRGVSYSDPLPGCPRNDNRTTEDSSSCVLRGSHSWDVILHHACGGHDREDACSSWPINFSCITTAVCSTWSPATVSSCASTMQATRTSRHDGPCGATHCRNCGIACSLR